LGVLLAFAIVAPGLGQDVEQEGSENPGRQLAVGAGCDLTQKEVPMAVSAYDPFVEPGAESAPGAETVEDAVLQVAGDLAADGAVYSREALVEAARQADVNTSPILVRLPGASIDVLRMPNGTYLVTGLVQCA
jgi:hypothetical protein